jgi:hypothetical protein
MRYQANGFIPVSTPPARHTKPAAAVAIVKGDYLIDDGSGYATNTGTAFAVAGLGIAAADCDNSGGSVGDKNVEIFPIDTLTRYRVPVAANQLIALTNKGTLIDLEANDDVDISDTTITAGAYAFFVDDIDVSADAVAANTYGYAIGHFQMGHA